jgi:hypothetical protein
MQATQKARNFIAVTCYASGTAVANPFLLNIIPACSGSSQSFSFR